MKTLRYYIPLLLLLFTACKKNCELPEAVNKGIIVNNVVFKSFSLKKKIKDNEGLLIRSQEMNEEYGSCTVSFDGGDSFQPINFAQYSLVGARTVSLCSSSFIREIQKDEIGNFINYKILINECKEGCDFEVATMNWVLIPAVDDTYKLDLYIN